jgi:hypothetical protein
MTTTDMLKELKRLPMDQQLAFVEAALHLVRQELAPRARSTTAGTPRSAGRRQMAAAAKKLLSDYASDRELTAFTSLDAEDFSA